MHTTARDVKQHKINCSLFHKNRSHSYGADPVIFPDDFFVSSINSFFPEKGGGYLFLSDD